MIAGNWFYTILFLWLILLLLPRIIFDSLEQPYFGFALVTNLLVFCGVGYQCSSKEMPFLAGMCIIAGACNLGPLNVLYAPLRLGIAYLFALSFAVQGIVRGRVHSMRCWRDYVGKRYQLVDAIDAAREDTEHTSTYQSRGLVDRPNPSNLEIDFHDPESILFGASILDQYGEWDQAIELYEHDQWPKDYGTYATNCMAEVKRKKTDS